MRNFQVILEQAAFAGCFVDVKTKERGIITGIFTGVDEFDTDDERLGYYLSFGDGYYDSVYLDEIVDIRILPKAESVTRQAV